MRAMRIQPRYISLTKDGGNIPRMVRPDHEVDSKLASSWHMVQRSEMLTFLPPAIIMWPYCRCRMCCSPARDDRPP